MLKRIRSGKGKAGEQAGTGDAGTRLAGERTDLAVERSYLASERTLMAWIRTTLSMITFGFTIGKLGQVLHNINIKGVMGTIHTLSLKQLSYFLVVLGIAALLGAMLQYRVRVHELHEMGGLRPQLSIAFIVALLLAVVGVFALTFLILEL